MLLVLALDRGGESGDGRRHRAELARRGGREAGVVGEDGQVLQAGGHGGHRQVALEARRREGRSLWACTGGEAAGRRAGQSGGAADHHHGARRQRQPRRLRGEMSGGWSSARRWSPHVLDHGGDAFTHRGHADVVVQLVEIMGHGDQLGLGAGEDLLGSLRHLTAPCLAGAALLVL